MQESIFLRGSADLHTGGGIFRGGNRSSDLASGGKK